VNYRRILRTAVLALLLAGVVAGPVNAGKPQPSANATLAERTCNFVVSYSWSKFPGKNLIATVGLYERTASGDVLITSQSLDRQVGRTGSVGFVVPMTADQNPGGITLVAIGDLTDSKTSQTVAGSSAESATLTTTCG